MKKTMTKSNRPPLSRSAAPTAPPITSAQIMGEIGDFPRLRRALIESYDALAESPMNPTSSLARTAEGVRDILETVRAVRVLVFPKNWRRPLRDVRDQIRRAREMLEAGLVAPQPEAELGELVDQLHEKLSATRETAIAALKVIRDDEPRADAPLSTIVSNLAHAATSQHRRLAILRSQNGRTAAGNWEALVDVLGVAHDRPDDESASYSAVIQIVNRARAREIFWIKLGTALGLGPKELDAQDSGFKMVLDRVNALRDLFDACSAEKETPGPERAVRARFRRWLEQVIGDAKVLVPARGRDGPSTFVETSELNDEDLAVAAIREIRAARQAAVRSRRAYTDLRSGVRHFLGEHVPILRSLAEQTDLLADG